jgi:para-nitrobenzyl esterase
MRKIKAEDLVKTSLAPQQVMVDGYVLEKQPYEVYQEKNNNEEILLNGFNVKEADAFVVPKFLFSPTNKDNIQERLAVYFNQDIADKLVKVYEKEIQEDAFTTFNEIISVFWFMNPHHEWSRIALDAGVKVYSYQFTKENKYHGNYHAGELIYAYGNVRRDKHTVRYDESDALLSDKMVTYWSNFAKTGDPNSAGLPTWNPYSVDDNNLLEFGTEVKEITDPYLKTYPIIQEYMDSLETN